MGRGLEPPSWPVLTPPPFCAVGVFARAPVPGQTKTRLIPAMGAQGASQLAVRMLRHALRVAKDAQLGPVILWAADDPNHPLWKELAQEFEVPIRMQGPGDLGDRMYGAMKSMRADIGGHALILGSDVPALKPEHLRCAAQALNHHAWAVLPADDGGYVLIAARTPQPAPFSNIAWGSDQVLAQTRRRCVHAQLGLWEGPVLWDVDRPIDLVRLHALGWTDLPISP